MTNRGNRKIYEDNKDAILLDYSVTKSAWVTGKKFGIKGSTLYYYLGRDNTELHRTKHSPEIIKKVKNFYLKNFNRGDGLDEFATSIGINKSSVSMIANSLGLTDRTRSLSEESKNKSSVTKRENWHTNRDEKLKRHKSPFGSFTKEQRKTNSSKAGQATKKRHKNEKDWSHDVSVKTLKTKFSRGVYSTPRGNASWKSGNRTIGDRTIYFRSRWEANYARYLQFLKEKKAIKDWQYEKTVYWFDKIKRGVVSYLPDFDVFENNGRMDHHEVKGWMDARSKTKLKRMAKYYPEKTVKIIDKHWFRDVGKQIKGLIPDWESDKHILKP